MDANRLRGCRSRQRKFARLPGDVDSRNQFTFSDLQSFHGGIQRLLQCGINDDECSRRNGRQFKPCIAE